MLQRPDKGPKIKVANKVGTSLKSNVKYGGKMVMEISKC